MQSFALNAAGHGKITPSGDLDGLGRSQHRNQRVWQGRSIRTEAMASGDALLRGVARHRLHGGSGLSSAEPVDARGVGIPGAGDSGEPNRFAARSTPMVVDQL